MMMPSGEILLTDQIVRGCNVMVGEHEQPADLILIELRDFDVILGMDWLTSYHATIDYRQKTVIF